MLHETRWTSVPRVHLKFSSDSAHGDDGLNLKNFRMYMIGNNNFVPYWLKTEAQEHLSTTGNTSLGPLYCPVITNHLATQWNLIWVFPTYLKSISLIRTLVAVEGCSPDIRKSNIPAFRHPSRIFYILPILLYQYIRSVPLW